MEKFGYDLIVFTSGPKAYAPKRLQEECDKKGLKFKAIKYREININFTSSGYELEYLGKAIPTSKNIFLRGIGEDPIYSPLKLVLNKWYKSLNATVINYDSFLLWPALDKTSQYLLLSESNLPIVESYSFGDPDSFLNWAADNYPFIAKDIAGSCGVGVYKIKNEEDINKLKEDGFMSIVKIKTLLFQRFLTGGEDLRVIVLGGKTLGAMKRIAQEGQYLTNFSQGGSVENYDIKADESASKIALNVAKLFKLDYCGVDLMKNQKGDWIVLEVNRACQFEGFEKATGANVAKRIVNYLVG